MVLLENSEMFWSVNVAAVIQYSGQDGGVAGGWMFKISC